MAKVKEVPSVMWEKKTMRPPEDGRYVFKPWQRHRSYTMKDIVLEIQEAAGHIDGMVFFLNEKKIYRGSYKSVDLAKRGTILKALRGVRKK